VKFRGRRRNRRGRISGTELLPDFIRLGSKRIIGVSDEFGNVCDMCSCQRKILFLYQIQNDGGEVAKPPLREVEVYAGLAEVRIPRGRNAHRFPYLDEECR